MQITHIAVFLFVFFQSCQSWDYIQVYFFDDQIPNDLIYLIPIIGYSDKKYIQNIQF